MSDMAEINEDLTNPLRSARPVRALPGDLLWPEDAKNGALACEITNDDPVLRQVEQLLADEFAGVILTGPPGTGKTWYARQLAAKLADRDPKRVRFTQFHSAYQYEDFVEGYVPDGEGGFVLKPKHLLLMCETAEEVRPNRCVLVMDELSRCNPARVFGEALTYVEITYRGKPFHVASGSRVCIPSNLVFLATMNPFDRGIDEVDAAMQRRFAKIAMDPDPEVLRIILRQQGLPEELIGRVLTFFLELHRKLPEAAQIGHAYFMTGKDADGLRRLWNHQIRFHLRKSLRLQPETLRELEEAWSRVFQSGPADGA